MDTYNEPGRDRAVECPVFLRATVGRDLWLLRTAYKYELVAGDDGAGVRTKAVRSSVEALTESAVEYEQEEIAWHQREI